MYSVNLPDVCPEVSEEEHFEPGPGGPIGFQDYPGGVGNGCQVSCDIVNLLGQLVSSAYETCFEELACGQTSPQQYSSWVNNWSWLANAGNCGGSNACYCVETSFTTQMGG